MVWNVVIGLFLFSWAIGLLTELQRSEVISFQKLLYYPISLTGTFLVNYLSSFASFTLIVFLPAMVGLCIASVVALGPYFLVTLPMLFGLVLMVTAVTYQFRGWLASLMMNKRRRRTLVTAIGAAFILLVQLPNLFNRLYLRSRTEKDVASSQKIVEETQRLSEDLKRHAVSPQQAQERLDAIKHAQSLERKAGTEFKSEDVVRWVRIADLVIPPGWVAYGAAEASHQIAWPGLLGAAGLCLIGAVSLRRSYHTTLRFYRGDYESGEKGKKRIAARPRGERPTLLVERQLAWRRKKRRPRRLPISCIGPRARGENDAVIAAHCRSNLRLDARGRQKIPSAGNVSAHDGHGHHHDRDTEPLADFSKPIRLRPRRISHLAALSGSTAKHPSREKPVTGTPDARQRGLCAW